MMTSPVFIAGLTLRLLLIVAVLPWTHETWFLPFLRHVPQTQTLDVWADFLASGGNVDAFPYGLLYIVVFVPGVALGSTLGGAAGAAIGLGLTVLTLDLVMLFAVLALGPKRLRARLTMFYWLSPLVLYIGYWHGQLDLLPTLVLTLGLIALKRNHLTLSAALAGIAISAKFSMVVALPFVVVYLVASPRYAQSALRYLVISLVTAALLLGPLAFFDGFRDMVLGTPELGKSIALFIPYGDGLNLYVLPMAYAGLLLLAWRIRRTSFDELICMIGLVFLALYMLTPASPGWAMWFGALLALHAARSGPRAGILYLALNMLFVGLHLLLSAGASSLIGSSWSLASQPASVVGVPTETLVGWVFSMFAVAAGALALQMLRERIFENNFHLVTRRPLMIGIAGDSGAGKDTLCELVTVIFGERSVCNLSGDDYHTWDRHKPMWRALTHLHPKANDLDRFAGDAHKLGRRRNVVSPHYDHHVGRMTKPRKVAAREIVLVSGLHALYPASLDQRYHLKVFLDMHEGLRRYLKVRRDVSVRGHPLQKVLRSIESRYSDSRLYIQPQKDKADFVISLEPVRASLVEDFTRPPDEIQLRLRVSSKHGDDMARLESLLVAVCGLHVYHDIHRDGRVEIVIEGKPSREEVAIVARRLAPEMDEFLALRPAWQAGQSGLLQLLMLDQINRVRASAGGTT